MCANSSSVFRKQMWKAGLLDLCLFPLALDVHSVFSQSQASLFQEELNCACFSLCEGSLTSLCSSLLRWIPGMQGSLTPTVPSSVTSVTLLGPCTCHSVPMSQTGNFSPAHCREEWVGEQSLRTPQEGTEGSGRLAEPVPKVTLPLGPPSPAPPESLGAWLHILLGHLGGGKAVQPTHRESCSAPTSHWRRSFTHENTLLLLVLERSLLHISPWKSEKLFPDIWPKFLCPLLHLHVDTLYPFSTVHIFAGTKIEKDNLLNFVMDSWIFCGDKECGKEKFVFVSG